MAERTKFIGLSVNEICDLLLESDFEGNKPPLSITLMPPIENPDADTDIDSDRSDEEVEFNPVHLPRRVLQSEAEIYSKNCDPESEDESTIPEEMPSTSAVPPARKRRRQEIKWTRCENRVGTGIPDYKDLYHPNGMDLMKENIKRPLDALEVTLPVELVDLIVHQSELYAVQKGLSAEMLNKENILVFLGILMISGYNKLPHRRLYWSTSPDVHNDLVSKSMRRNTFDEIMRRLHFADNMGMNDDRYYKVRPFFDILNKAFKVVDSAKYLSIDETIVPNYGRHGTKQFIRGKPIRFGFKLWSLYRSDGYLLHAEPYCGSSTKLPVSGNGQGFDVVTGLLQKADVRKGSHVVFDNFFTSINLLSELAKRSIAGTGTIRDNRLHKSPLTPKSAMQKRERGAMEKAVADNIVVVRWNDNQVVSVASNAVKVHPIAKAKRWSRKEKKTIQVPQPQLITIYNKHMGGVDSHDQFVATYRVRVRSKKWWWPLFAWGLNASIVNAWRLYQDLGHDIPLINFQQQCCLQLLGQYGEGRKVSGPKLQIRGAAHDGIRYDKLEHWIVKGNQPNARCKYCGRRTTFICEKCNVALHPECHKLYHIPS